MSNQSNYWRRVTKNLFIWSKTGYVSVVNLYIASKRSRIQLDRKNIVMFMINIRIEKIKDTEKRTQ